MLVNKGTVIVMHGLFLQRDWIINTHQDIYLTEVTDLDRLEDEGLVSVSLGKRNYNPLLLIQELIHNLFYKG